MSSLQVLHQILNGTAFRTPRDIGAPALRTAAEGLAAKEPLDAWAALVAPAEGVMSAEALFAFIAEGLPTRVQQRIASEELLHVGRVLDTLPPAVPGGETQQSLPSSAWVDRWIERNRSLPVVREVAQHYAIAGLDQEVVEKEQTVGMEGARGRPHLERILRSEAPLGAFDPSNSRKTLAELLEGYACAWGPERKPYPFDLSGDEVVFQRLYDGEARFVFRERIADLLRRVKNDLTRGLHPLAHLASLAKDLRRAGFQDEPLQRVIAGLLEADQLTRTGKTTGGVRPALSLSEPEPRLEPATSRLLRLRAFAERRRIKVAEGERILREAMAGVREPRRDAPLNPVAAAMKPADWDRLEQALRRGLPGETDRKAATELLWATQLVSTGADSPAGWSSKLLGVRVMMRLAPMFERAFPEYSDEVREQAIALRTDRAVVQPLVDPVLRSRAPLGVWSQPFQELTLDGALARLHAYYAKEPFASIRAPDGHRFYQGPAFEVAGLPIDGFVNQLRGDLAASRDPVRTLQEAVTDLTASAAPADDPTLELLTHLLHAHQFSAG